MPSASLLDTVVSDMSGVHDAKPHGVPDNVGWASAPRVGMGNEPGSWTAMVPWGQVYLSASGSAATNTRVEVRDIRAFLLSRSTGRWTQIVSSTGVEGAAYREDFAGNVSIPADLRTEPDGGLSVKLAANHNFHFWSPSRVTIDPKDVGGIVVTVRARLVVDDPRMADDRASARIVAGMGGDYWADQNARWDNWTTNGDFAIGKLKYVRNEWTVFSASTLGANDLRGNPPPLS